VDSQTPNKQTTPMKETQNRKKESEPLNYLPTKERKNVEVTAHHLYAFRKFRRSWWCSGLTNQKPKPSLRFFFFSHCPLQECHAIRAKNFTSPYLVLRTTCMRS